QPFLCEIVDRETVAHHRTNRGLSSRAAIPAVVHGQKIYAHAVVNGSQIVIIGHDFAVSVKKKDIWRLFAGKVETGAYGDFLPYRNIDVLCERICDRSRLR